MSDAAHPSCSFCRWWDDSQVLPDHPDSGACRVQPPKMDKVRGIGVWPFTDVDDWCGSFVIDEKKGP